MKKVLQAFVPSSRKCRLFLIREHQIISWYWSEAGSVDPVTATLMTELNTKQIKVTGTHFRIKGVRIPTSYDLRVWLDLMYLGEDIDGIELRIDIPDDEQPLFADINRYLKEDE